MRGIPRVAAAAGMATVVACSPQLREPETETIALAQLYNAGGTEVGEAELLQTGDTLTISVSLFGLPEGARALHLHQTAVCEAPAFASAGGHFNPTGRTHGMLSEDGPHLGDLPNIDVTADGTFSGVFPLEGSATDLLPSLFDEDGTAVMLHEGPDDYRTDPSGAAGPRLACGVLERP